MKVITGQLICLAIIASFSYAAPSQRRPQNENWKDRRQAKLSSSSVSLQKTTTINVGKTTITPSASSAAKSTALSSAQPSAQPAAAPEAPPVLLSQLTAEQAGGGTPGGPPPQTTFSPNAIANFKVANFIEGIESGFFADALITLKDDAQFTHVTPDGKSMVNITTQIAAQELVHKATLEGLLGLAQEPVVPACTSIIPVDNTPDFLARANVVTAAAIGVIITILASLASSDDNALLAPLSSILSVESQQDTFFRMVGNNTPSASPFNTGLSLSFAYNIALTYVDPLSCPQLNPSLPILPSMNVTSPLVGASAPETPPTVLTFKTAADNAPQGGNMFVGWVNQANPVIYTNVSIANGIGTAEIPKGMTGMAFGALTMQNVAQTVDGLSNATIAGPAVVLMS